MSKTVPMRLRVQRGRSLKEKHKSFKEDLDGQWDVKNIKNISFAAFLDNQNIDRSFHKQNSSFLAPSSC